MACAFRLPGRVSLVLASTAILASGCQLAPRQEVDECHRLSQTLRSENTALRDQMLVLKSDNQDFSERAVDDARRLAQLESSNQQLETSVQAYQEERARLETAYQELRASLPGSLQPMSSAEKVGERATPSGGRKHLDKQLESVPSREQDPEIQQANSSGDSSEAAIPARLKKSARVRDAWLPSKTKPSPEHSADSLSTRTDP